MNNVVEDIVIRKYYRIGVVAKELSMSTSAIRFWEEELIWYVRPAKRDKSNRRVYSPKQAKRFHIIRALVKECGMTLHGAGNAIQEGWAGEFISMVRNWRKGLRDENI